MSIRYTKHNDMNVALDKQWKSIDWTDPVSEAKGLETYNRMDDELMLYEDQMEAGIELAIYFICEMNLQK